MKKPQPQWLEGSQLDYFNTAATKVGFDNLPLAWGLSLVSWQSKDQLNEFLDALVYKKTNNQQGAA